MERVPVVIVLLPIATRARYVALVESAVILVWIFQAPLEVDRVRRRVSLHPDCSFTSIRTTAFLTFGLIRPWKVNLDSGYPGVCARKKLELEVAACVAGTNQAIKAIERPLKRARANFTG